MKDIKLRRSISERKLAKDQKKDRKEKSKSEHFDRNGLHAQPISIIGSKDKEDATASPGSPISPTDEDSTGKKNNKFIWNLKSKMKKKKARDDSTNGNEGDDEGFESSPEKIVNFNGLPEDQNKGEEGGEKLENEQKEEDQSGITAEEKEEILSKSPYFRVEVSILCGRELIAMDRGGTSDPYVRIMQGEEQLHKSPEKKKTVNPVWNDQANVYIENAFEPLTFQVYDKDIVGTDDFMGQADFDLTTCEIKKSNEVTLHLEDGGDEDLIRKNKKRKTLGYIIVRIILSPLTKEEYNEILRSQKDGKGAKQLRLTGVVHVLLVQARSVIAMDGGTSSDPYCKVTLGKEKAKTKVINNTLNPKWREAMDLFWYEELDDFIDIALFDHDVGGKDDRMGRVAIDLRELSKEVSHNLWRPIKDGEGMLNVIITISGTTKTDSPSNLSNWNPDPHHLVALEEKYAIANTFYKMKDVGHLIVKVIKAQGLHSADLGGKSDPFAVLELVNDRLLTQTEYKTLAPVWQKVFTFDVRDIHDILEVTVFDEDKEHKYEFLGKIMVPLMRIKNGEKKWFKLKDKTLRKKAKGDDPQILLEMNLSWNPIRASIRTFNPKQLKYEDKSDTKFKFATFNKNVNRVKAATAHMDPEVAIRELKSILNWENKAKSAGAFIGYLLGVWFFEPWMITFGLLFPFIGNMIFLTVTGGWNKDPDDEEEEEEEEGGDSKTEEGEKKSLKEKMQAMQDIALLIQGHLGFLAHVLESVKNVFNFSVPFLSWLAFVVVFIITIVLYYVPLRVLLILWGTNKFLKKLIKPWAINNNELADFISRVPDNEELKDFKEISKADEIDKKTLAKMKKNAARDADII